MEWYYKSKTVGAKHGVVDDKTLAEMIQKGELKPVDLVWSEQTGGRWVQAQTVDGLFPKAGKNAEETQKVMPQYPAPKRAGLSRHVRRVLWLVVAAIAVYGGMVLFRGPSESGNAPLFPFFPTEQQKLQPLAQPAQAQTNQAQQAAESNVNQEVVNSNQVVALTAQFNTVMSNEDLDAASRLIVDIAKSSEETLKVQALSRRMVVLRQVLARCFQLDELLQAGKIDGATAKEMVALYDSRKKRSELVNKTKAILADPDALTSDVCLSVARVCIVLDDHPQTKAALDNYVGHVKVVREKSSEYMEVAHMLFTESDPLRSAELMRKYLLIEPANSDVWLEFAAWKCVGGDPDAAINALDQAIKCGDKMTKQKAQEDDRFVSIKDKSAFRSLVTISPPAVY